MAYQSLYRKYRSRDFADLVGQRHITQTLANAISSGRVAHAYLFCGPRGTGKTSTARVLAKAVNCVNGPTAEPCDTCSACLSIKSGAAMDVIEIDAASNRNIDDIRQLREQVNYAPVELRYKFYIVDEVHQLTRDSFNAFLKTLEEPPAHVIFVLCTTDPHQLPATILSRCQRFDFHRIPRDEIISRLRWVVDQEGWTIEDDALYLLARSANGGLRDALSLLDQAASYAGKHIAAEHVRDILGGIDLDLLIEMTELMLKRDGEGLFRTIDRVMSEGKDVPQLVGELIQHWRNLLRAAIGGGQTLVELSPEQRKTVAHQATLTDKQAIMRAITLLCEAENELRWNSQQRLLLELYCLRIVGEDAAASRPSRMEAHSEMPAPRPQPRQEAPAPRVEPRQEAPAPRPAAAARPAAPATEAPAAPTNEEGPWTFQRMKKAWPEFSAWMNRSSNLDNLRTRVVEKCWPTGLNGAVLQLATASNLTRSLLYDRPAVKQALEQCLQSYFKSNFAVEMIVQGENDPAPADAPTSAPAAEAPPRDIVADRVKQVFANSVEITE